MKYCKIHFNAEHSPSKESISQFPSVKKLHCNIMSDDDALKGKINMGSDLSYGFTEAV